MLQRFLGHATLVAILGAAACSAPASFTDADMQANRQLVDRWTAYLNAKQWDSLAQLYTENASVMPPNMPTLRGRPAIRDFIASFPPITAFRIVDDTIDGVGGLAYARGRYWMTVAGTPDSGKFVEVRRKQPDGSWRLEVDIFSSNVPLPPPPPPARK
jgi:ketosteroid isomerase-like protein